MNQRAAPEPSRVEPSVARATVHSSARHLLNEVKHTKLLRRSHGLLTRLHRSAMVMQNPSRHVEQDTHTHTHMYLVTVA